MSQRPAHSERHRNATSVGAQDQTNPTRSVSHEPEQSYHQHGHPNRVDFVSRLPHELVSFFILPPILMLPSRQTFEYLHVCRTWRQRVLQSVQLYYLSSTRVTSRDTQIMVAYAPYITRITLRNPSELPLYFLSRSQFASLLSLDFTLTSQNDMRASVRLLQSIAAVLKEIKLTVSYGIPNATIAFKDIMTNCPHLEAFTCNRIDMAGFTSQGHVQKYPNIKKLIFKSTTHPLQVKDIIGLLERFPSLQLLSLPQCQHSAPLSLISQYCPYLDSLTYTAKEKAPEAVHCPRTDNEIGLHSVFVYAGENFHIGDIASLLARHCDTLISIHLVGRIRYHQGGVSSAILSQHVYFKRLSNLIFYNEEDDNGTDDKSALLEWILKGAPNAEEIYTPRCLIGNQPVCHTMSRMTALESLWFSLPYTAFVGGLEHHATTLQQRSKLHILSIDVHDNSEQCACLWEAVPGLCNLQELSMELGGATLGQDFVTFIEALGRDSPFLRKLCLESPTEFPTEIISKFPLYANLRELTLDSQNFWDECLLDIIHCPSLQALHMETLQIREDVAATLAHFTLLQ